MYTHMHACIQACILTCMHACIGSITFAGRFFLISMHPMKLNGTMMNSFLFNVMQLLLCSISCVQVMCVCASVRACVHMYVYLCMCMHERALVVVCVIRMYVCAWMHIHIHRFQKPPSNAHPTFHSVLPYAPKCAYMKSRTYIQLCSRAFKGFAHSSAISQIFVTQVLS